MRMKPGKHSSTMNATNTKNAPAAAIRPQQAYQLSQSMPGGEVKTMQATTAKLTLNQQQIAAASSHHSTSATHVTSSH